MRYAEVAVDAPVSHSRTFSYSIPDTFSVEPGQLVWVPFGRRLLQGLVVRLSPTAQVETTRDILQPLEPSPLVGPIGLALGIWLSRYYFCSLFECLSLLLPPGFKAQVRSRVSTAPITEEELASARQVLPSRCGTSRTHVPEPTTSLCASTTIFVTHACELTT